MGNTIYSINFGAFLLNYSFLYSETGRLFGNYLNRSVDGVTEPDIFVTPEYMEENRWLIDENEKSKSFIEFQSLMLATGNMLLLHHRALFHGVALLWNDHAWIITAPSGTGKTTQLRHWKKMLGQGVEVINGDKPLMECREDGSVWVHSSPWRGKEKYGHQGMSAKLGGIILLEQGSRNQIERLALADAVLPLFIEFVSYPENTMQIRCQSEILQQMLSAVPVWKLINCGDEDSAILTKNSLENYLEKQHE